MFQRILSGLKPGDLRNIVLDVMLLFYSVSFAVEKIVLHDWLWAGVYGGFSLICSGLFVWDMTQDLKEMRRAKRLRRLRVAEHPPRR